LKLVEGKPSDEMLYGFYRLQQQSMAVAPPTSSDRDDRYRHDLLTAVMPVFSALPPPLPTDPRPNTTTRRRYRSVSANVIYVNYNTVNKNSSVDEIANVNFYAVRPEGTRIR